MVRIVKDAAFKNEYYSIITDNEETEILFNSYPVLRNINEVWAYLTQIMYQFNSNACLVIDETKKRHVIYRLWENGKKEKLPIQVRNSEANTVTNKD